MAEFEVHDQASAPREISEPRIGDDYDPRPARERVRERLALALTGLLALVTVLLILIVAFGLRSWSEIQGIAAVTYGPLVSLTATMLGFYYGQSRQ